VSNGSELKSAGAQRLRAAGYRPCPRWWLTQEQYELVEYMAKQNEEEVNRLRHGNSRADLTKEEEIELAWRRMKTGGENT
jgi:hypothetical protein